MSAADRLRVLDEAMTPGTWDDETRPMERGGSLTGVYSTDYGVSLLVAPCEGANAHGISSLRNALPALIEVVANVEKVREYDVQEVAEDGDAMNALVDAMEDMYVALAALDEALGGEA